MNTIDELLNKLSPNGVKFIQLGEVCSTFSGGFIKKTKQDSGFPYPVFNGGAFATGRYSEFNSEANSIAISARGSIGFVNWIPHRFWAGNSCHVVLSKVEFLETKFVYHYLKAHEGDLYALRNVGTIPALNLAPLLKFKIPIPPLEVQKEIIAIIDTFTELESELEAELEARKSQYAFYRESLFEEDISSLKALASVASIWRGRRFVKDDILSAGVPAIHYGEIYTKFGLAATEAYSFLDPVLAAKLRFASPGDVVLVSAGETIEDIGKSFTWFGREDVVIHDACYGLRSETVDPRYMVHFFNTYNFRSQLRKYISSSKISSVSTEKLGKVCIPVPSLQRQREVAEVLDAFDSLISDTSNGLPAEINARRKQHEYYRNKLLAFKELEAA